MYSVVLMAALATASSSPQFGHRNGCNGCYGGGHAVASGCYGCYGGGGWGSGCYGSGWGCHGGRSCFGSSSGWNCFGCHGGYGSSWGCYGSPYATWGCYGSSFYHANGVLHGSGCTGCYGCYGGYSCYGVPIPVDSTPVYSTPPPVGGAPPPAPGAGKKVPEVAPPPVPVPDKKKGDLQVRVKVRFNIPDDARLFVDGVEIKTAATSRVFQTPDLDVAKTYFYDVRVELRRNGEVVSETQRIVIRPGEDVVAAFPNLEQRAVATAQRK